MTSARGFGLGGALSIRSLDARTKGKKTCSGVSYPPNAISCRTRQPQSTQPRAWRQSGRERCLHLKSGAYGQRQYRGQSATGESRRAGKGDLFTCSLSGFFTRLDPQIEPTLNEAIQCEQSDSTAFNAKLGDLR
jgi:hypothetical protein